MNLAKTYSAQLIGLMAEIITIEVDISNGLHTFAVVGLGDRSVEEAKDRVAAAIKNSGYTSPKQKNQKVVISLAPADIRKEGPVFDLSMALGYLAAAGDIAFDPEEKLFLGELSLEGGIRKISGALLMLCQAPIRGFKEAFIPKENSYEASLAQGIVIYPVSSLQEVIEHLLGIRPLTPIAPYEFNALAEPAKELLDMNTVRGNETAKRGLEIAAAGGHNVLMCGQPGTGKTMLAQSFPSILPALSYEESVEVTGIHSASRVLGRGLVRQPPFRSPHHTASYVSIVGGGTFPRPGEITLAHRGVLFMDEFSEFDRKVIEALRQPLEDRVITISRARGMITFPAECILIAAMNPCPCGKQGTDDCTCSPFAVERYWNKVSGPVMDRMDIWLNVNKIDYEKLARHTSDGETSEAIKKRVIAARTVQNDRFKKYDISKRLNGEMNARDIEICALVEDDARSVLAISAEKFKLSGRAFHRIIKVARTIADLAGQKTVRKEDILEAIQYRQKLRET